MLLLKVGLSNSRHITELFSPHRTHRVHRRGLLLQMSVRNLRLVSTVSPAETAKPIQMRFGVLTRVGTMTHVPDGVHMGATWRIRLNDT